jgi:hypothetical protein
VNVPTGRFGETLERLLPFLTVVAVVTCGYLWFIQPSLGTYLRARSDAQALAERALTLQRAVGRAPVQPATGDQASIHEFEMRMSADDKVPDVAAALAAAVLAAAPPDKLRAFTIETGDRVQSPAGGGSAGAPRDPASPLADASDPRLALFPYAVTYTPVRVSFESTFEAAGSFLWNLRDLPTVVELRSATLSRGLPLMKADVLIRVFQRGEAMDAGQVVMPGTPGAPPSPTAPRVAPPQGEEGGVR